MRLRALPAFACSCWWWFFLALRYWKLAKASRLNILTVNGKWVLREDLFGNSDGGTKADNDATKAYDKEAMRHVFHVVYPLVVGYSAFSLAHTKHKSWCVVMADQ